MTTIVPFQDDWLRAHPLRRCLPPEHMLGGPSPAGVCTQVVALYPRQVGDAPRDACLYNPCQR
jgi:hypothetical protein